MLLDVYFAMVFMVLVVLVRGLDQYADRQKRTDRFRSFMERPRQRRVAERRER